MFGTLGGPELFLILVVALIVFGPRRLPEIGKSMGKMLAEFRKASNDFKRTIEDEIESENRRPTEPAQIASAPADATGAGPAGAAAGVAPGPAGQTGLPEPISPEPAPRLEPPGEPTISRETPVAPPPIEPK